MSSTTLEPTTDITVAGWNNSGGAASYSAALADASDTTILVSVSGSTGPLVVELGSLPGDFSTASGVTVNVRLQATSSKGEQGVTVQVFQNDGTTALTTTTSSGTITTSLANYALTMSLSGTQNAAAWTGAKLSIVVNNSSHSTNMPLANVAVTYTSATVPGQPTGLSATWSGGGTVALTYTAPGSNGGASITDYVGQYSTDCVTWTPFDLSTAGLSGNVTGLSLGTPYYIEVAAVNSAGTGTYSLEAEVFTGSVQTLTAQLVATLDTLTSGWTITGASTAWQATTDGSDSSYIVPSTNPAVPLQLTLSAPPPSMIVVTAVSVTGRAETTNGSFTLAVPFSFLRAGGATALVGGGTSLTTSLTTSPANYTAANAWGLIGTQGVADWTNAILELSPPDTHAANRIYELTVTITYWEISVDQMAAAANTTIQTSQTAADQCLYDQEGIIAG